MIGRSDRGLSVLSSKVAREESFCGSNIDGSGVGSWSAGSGELFASSRPNRSGRTKSSSRAHNHDNHHNRSG
jgi:hypothetical protein